MAVALRPFAVSTRLLQQLARNAVRVVNVRTICLCVCMYIYNSALKSSSPGGSPRNNDNWNHPALTPTSSTAQRRSSGGQSRSRKRRDGGSELFFDESGALDLTQSARKAARPSNVAARRPAVAPMVAVADDALPLDLSVRSRLPYVSL